MERRRNVKNGRNKHIYRFGVGFLAMMVIGALLTSIGFFDDDMTVWDYLITTIVAYVLGFLGIALYSFIKKVEKGMES